MEMLQAFALFLTILAGQGTLGLMGVDAASLAPIEATNFNSHTQTPPDSSGGQMVFNWNDGDDEGDHNAIDTRIFMLTNGGNSSLADNSTGQYVIEALAVQFNKTHFTQDASSTPWVAIFPCTKNSPAGNTSDLIANAEKLGAHAILAYTEGATYQFCNLTNNTPSATIPIYITETWHNSGLVFSDQINDLFAPSPIKFYDAAAMNKLASNITADFAALQSNSSFLIQTHALLVRIPAIASNVTAAAEASETSSGPAPTKSPNMSPNAAWRMRVGVGIGGVIGMQTVFCMGVALGLGVALVL
ncbi:hypothetical protein MVEN_01285500 [Mycena venus]|uniref:Uncharacterized protein n=1 Tax=Mycena venus TaxID=2733690 RepID=A0A8H6Y152_9AGAR|nr:hypothetical protein MVEN_01285500 [Mycena venus]